MKLLIATFIVLGFIAVVQVNNHKIDNLEERIEDRQHRIEQLRQKAQDNSKKKNQYQEKSQKLETQVEDLEQELQAKKERERRLALVESAQAQSEPAQAQQNTQPVSSTSSSVKDRVKSAAESRGWGNQWNALDELIHRESTWNAQAINPTSGACGLFQALPCSKMGGMGISNQINWGLNYIENRYGSPVNALGHHNSHNWY